jgi:hypothetical protein
MPTKVMPAMTASGVKLVCFFIDLKVPLGPDWDEMQVPQSG